MKLTGGLEIIARRVLPELGVTCANFSQHAANINAAPGCKSLFSSPIRADRLGAEGMIQLLNGPSRMG